MRSPTGFKCAKDGTYEAVKKYLGSEGLGRSKTDVPKVF